MAEGYNVAHRAIDKSDALYVFMYIMNVCSFTDLREHLRERLDEVHESRTPLLVTRQGAASAVVLDKEEYDGIMETLHLLRSPKNAERLLQAIADLDAGNAVMHDLIDP